MRSAFTRSFCVVQTPCAAPRWIFNSALGMSFNASMADASIGTSTHKREEYYDAIQDIIAYGRQLRCADKHWHGRGRRSPAVLGLQSSGKAIRQIISRLSEGNDCSVAGTSRPSRCVAAAPG